MVCFKPLFHQWFASKMDSSKIFDLTPKQTIAPSKTDILMMRSHIPPLFAQ